jgi:hypothetical protein
MVDIANPRESAQTQHTRLGRLLGYLAQGLASVGSFLARIYYKVVYALAAPFARLAARLEATEQKILDRGRSHGILWRLVYWLWRLPVRAPRWALQKTAILIVDGPVWLASVSLFLAGLFFLVITPITYAEWVGGAWYGALFAWWVSKAYTVSWVRALGRVARLLAIGVTPQFIFLLLYNGLPELGIAVPSFLAPMVKAYEYLAVSVNDLLAPLSDIAWYWWLGVACGVLVLSWLLELPRLHATALHLREVLAAAVFALAVTGSVGFSYLVPAGAWEPNLQSRLQASLKEQAFYQATISLSEELSRWFTSPGGRTTHLPLYVRSFEDAIQEIRTGREGTQARTEDIRKGTQAAIKTLVPPEAAKIVAATAPASSAERHIPGTTWELLGMDAQLKDANIVLKVRANQIRASAVAVISQAVNVSVSSVPMLREILGEMITTTAEQISRQIVDRVPIERGIKTAQNTVEAVRSAVSSSADKIAEILFTSRAGPDLAHAKLALGAVVTNEIRRAAHTRVEAEAHRARAARARR